MHQSDKRRFMAVNDDNKKVYLFGGLELSPGNLYYDGLGYKIKDSWNYDSYNSIYGVKAGSYYFTQSDIRSIQVAYDDKQWRLPTMSEWNKILTTSSNVRAGSTVNGSVNKHYACIEVTGVTHAGRNSPYGILIFPDNCNITGASLSRIDSARLTRGITAVQLQNYLRQGCIFLPGSGYYYSSSWINGGTDVDYWASDTSNRIRYHSGNTLLLSGSATSNTFLTARLVRTF